MPRKRSLSTELPRRPARRPINKETARRLLAAVGVDPALIDPKRILAAIASDANAAPTARVRAAMALIERPEKQGPQLSKKIRDQQAADTAGGDGTGWDNDLNPSSDSYRSQ